MNMVALQKQMDEMVEEIKLSGEWTQGRIVDLRAEIENLAIQLSALKKFLELSIPSFKEEYPRILEQVAREMDTE